MFLGIDSGSTTTKLVLCDAEGAIVARRLAPTGADGAATVETLLAELLRESGFGESDITATVATGYGRRRIARAGRVVTEITCHAAGVRHLLPEARFIVDIGGQDSKAVRLDAAGRVEDFAMNDKCAAGTGRFLEVVAARFGVPVAELGRSVDPAGASVAINSTCAIFAETEVIGLLADGHSQQAVLAGVHEALARRVATLAEHLGFDGPVVLSGGVALNAVMPVMLERALGLPVQVCPEAQYTAALGAARLGR